MAQRSGINRALMWLRKTLEITEETQSPQVLSETLRPMIDVFGWERLTGLNEADNAEGVEGADNTDIVVLTAVPDGIMRYVIYASMSHNDPATNLSLSMQVRLSAAIGALDIGVAQSIKNTSEQPLRASLDRNILLQPGEQLICRSQPAPAIGSALFIRYKFVDLDPGEYLQALS